MPGKTGERPGRRRSGAAVKTEGEGVMTGQPGGVSQPMMDLDFVRGLITAVDESGIDSLEINRGGTRIKISKTPPPVLAAGALAQAAHPAQIAAPVAAPVPAAAAPVAPAPEPAAAAPTAEPAAAASKNLIEVKSPMVGTFYRAPAPEAPPYVEVGSTVTKGQTLCILEAMKLMNELEAEVDGVVREVLVSNAEPVEYGQVLFRIEPTAS